MRQRRELLKLSLRDVQKRSEGEVGHSTVGQIENDAYNPTIGMLDCIAGILGMSIEIRMVEKTGALPRERQELIDRLIVVIDKLEDRDVRALRGQLKSYEDELERSDRSH